MSTDGQVSAADTDGDERSREELRTQLELLAEENEQLRTSYTQAKTTQYKRTALGLAAVGLIAVVGGLLIPNARTVLFSLAGIGLFGGVLTYVLTPEQFVAADVGRDVYAVLADNEAAIVSELGLADKRLYVPTKGPDRVRLFVPQSATDNIPDSEAVSQCIVATDGGETRGVAFNPSGQQLFESVDDAVNGGVAAAPAELADQVTEAIVEQFEIARSATPDIDGDGGRLTVGVSGSVYGPVDRFDHPIPSLLGTALADRLDTPVTTEVTEGRDDQADYLITCQWKQK